MRFIEGIADRWRDSREMRNMLYEVNLPPNVHWVQSYYELIQVSEKNGATEMVAQLVLEQTGFDIETNKRSFTHDILLKSQVMVQTESTLRGEHSTRPIDSYQFRLPGTSKFYQDDAWHFIGEIEARKGATERCSEIFDRVKNDLPDVKTRMGQLIYIPDYMQRTGEDMASMGRDIKKAATKVGSIFTRS